MPGKVIGRTLDLGYAGTVSRNPDNISISRRVNEYTPKIAFGQAVKLNGDNSVSLMDENDGAEDFIGVMGTTGQSTGIHLHYEIRDPRGSAVNPAPYLGTDRQFGDDSAATPASEAAIFKVGDRVKINASAASYSTGQAIPSWVKGGIYTVQQLSSSGDKVLLKELYSWVWCKDLTKV